VIDRHLPHPRPCAAIKQKQTITIVKGLAGLDNMNEKLCQKLCTYLNSQEINSKPGVTKSGLHDDFCT